MTPNEMIEEFKSYPKSEKTIVLRKLLQIFVKDLEEIENKQVSNEERKMAIQRLRGIAAVEGKTPPTDEEIREDYTNYLIEKYK